MSVSRNPKPPPDVSLLLRTHAEQRWLSREVIPVIRQVESHEPPLPEEQLPAAIAYLEVIWMQAMSRARETEAARCHLDELGYQGQSLADRARRCHNAVRVLRETVARRVAPLIAAPAEPSASRQIALSDPTH